MPARHVKTRPVGIANARCSPAMAALCAQIGRVLARCSGTLKNSQPLSPKEGSDTQEMLKLRQFEKLLFSQGRQHMLGHQG